MKKKSKSHVVQLKEKVKSRILGKAKGHSTASQTGTPTETDASLLSMVKQPSDLMDVPRELWPKTVLELGNLLKKNASPTIPSSFLPVEQHGTTNDAARQVILSRVKTKS